jgi:hypothetical protein
VSDQRDEPREQRLLDLRREAERSGQIVPSERAEGYYGLPLLKPPVWTWEVPAYFFVGGAAGAAAVIGAVARRTGGEPSLVRDARWIAAVGAAASAPLLISDLGRPERFLNMLRVFKVRSPMSVGVWTLVAFASSAGATAFADLVVRRTRGAAAVQVVADAADALSASTGLVLSTYTGVLIGATAVPVWSDNVRLLPLHFSASAVATAASVLELLGHRHRALNRLAIGAALVETAIGLSLETGEDPSLDALRHARSGLITRLGGMLSGPVPLALRVLGYRSPGARRLAAAAAILGSLLTRIGWVEAGRESARTPARQDGGPREPARIRPGTQADADASRLPGPSGDRHERTRD